MNIAYSEELRPPKELFSREWFDTWGDTNSWLPRLRRIDETKRKLEELETKIRNNANRLTKGTRTLSLDISSNLKFGIGVWNAYSEDTITTNGYVKKTETQFKTNMIYPDHTRPTESNNWILGDTKRNGVCLIMLSPEAVQWLNRVDKWVSDIPSYITTSV